MRHRRAIVLLSAMSAGAGAAAAQAIDIRDCPLDTLVFVDPSWTGASFAVRRVGTQYTYLCLDGFQPPDAMCSGPYGYLVLEGEHRSGPDAQPETKTATYSVIKAAPCCDWNVENGVSSVTGNEGFKWLGAADMPKLRDMEFLSIVSEDGQDFGSPYFAAACRL